MELTQDEIKLLLFLVRNRLRYEAQRPARIIEGKGDTQSLKVYALADLREKLEEAWLAS